MGTNEDTTLLEFFKWWLREAESDNPDYHVTAYGLCYNARHLEIALDLDHLLYNIYEDSAFPFGGETQWDYDMKHDTMHLNLERIAFVKSQIERLEKLQSANQE